MNLRFFFFLSSSPSFVTRNSRLGTRNRPVSFPLPYLYYTTIPSACQQVNTTYWGITPNDIQYIVFAVSQAHSYVFLKKCGKIMSSPIDSLNTHSPTHACAAFSCGVSAHALARPHRAIASARHTCSRSHSPIRHARARNSRP